MFETWLWMVSDSTLNEKSTSFENETEILQEEHANLVFPLSLFKMKIRLGGALISNLKYEFFTLQQKRKEKKKKEG